VTEQEVREAYAELHRSGASDEDILASLFMMFRDGKIDLDGLIALCGILGYEPTEKFLRMSPEQQKEAGFKKPEDLDEFPLKKRGETI
jgi:hypothetical protein